MASQVTLLGLVDSAHPVRFTMSCTTATAPPRDDFPWEGGLVDPGIFAPTGVASVQDRKDEARRLLSVFIPDVKGYEMSKAAFETAGALECKLTVGAVLSQLREVWFLAHLVGW